jgi:UDP-3-O-[3-hydroxymyristoyl] glucosamine N-acyltransferase
MPSAFAVREVAGWVKGRLANAEALGAREGGIRIARPAPLAGSQAGDIAFFFSRAYQHELQTAAPGILVTGEDFIQPLEAAGLPLWKQTAVIACRDPYLAMALISEKLADGVSNTAHLREPGKAESHPTAAVNPEARLGRLVRVGAHCTIEAGAEIGDGSVLYPGCYIGHGAKIGKGSVLFPRVTVYEWALIGDRVRIHSGAVIGADGFGYAARIEGGNPVGHQKIHHLGRVVIGDDVEIGANTCIDRGTIGDTRIDRMAKIDNLVQVGHNVHIAEGAVICGDTALAGSSSVGKFAYVAGVCGIANQVHVGAGAKVAAMTLLSKDVPDGGTAMGNPQREGRDYLKVQALLSKMLADRKKR